MGGWLRCAVNEELRLAREKDIERGDFGSHQVLTSLNVQRDITFPIQFPFFQ
jgi:hypothetical protein